MIIFAIFLNLFICVTSCYGQSLQSVNWHFGKGACINFSTGSPIPVTNSSINAAEGVASISDSSGKILFYTDGITVYNKNNSSMLNGDGLMGHWSSTQSGVIIQFPGTSNQYIIFSNNTFLNPGSIHYSVVDMSLDNGLGDVVISKKNLLLISGVSEKVEIIKHCNGKDFWLVTVSADNFYVAPITSSGVGAFTIYSIPFQIRTHGYMKANAAGTKIALANWSNNIELFDFDITNGNISNRKVLYGIRNEYYGISFSPNDQLLYVSHMGRDGQCLVYQFDLRTDVEEQIQSSINIVASIASNSQNSYPEFSALQIGPDGKLYMAVSSWPPSPNHHPRGPLSVFNYPNLLGSASGFNFDAIALGSGTSRSGLPNIPAYLLNNGYYVSDTIYEGDYYKFGNQNIYISGIYNESFISSKGCDSTVTLYLYVINDSNLISDSSTYYFYVPNAFSPNNDNNNDIFYPIMKGVKTLNFRIWDRWGELIFECLKSNTTCVWDGTFNGKKCKPAVYVWEAIVETRINTIEKYKGSVTLIE